ncbi:MAG TPA: sulfatase [Candidatus Hydrogenedentes bacterium]|nr:sulfatase [Candidatus Hydrogenedentota bacterium]HPG69207.1 sulfatase [Candidatus Hydrogenedentota bacterium]
MNIILVVFDSLRKDCVGAYGSPPWGKVHTPHFDVFAEQSLVMTRMYPESLPTLPTRRALYTGRRVYPFHNADFHLKGDFVGAPGWGPIPEEQDTLAEMLREAGYRTSLIADVYHMFKPSKNYTRGFDQWMFLRGQETDPARSGPRLTQEELDHWLPREMQNEWTIRFIQSCIMNMRDRVNEADYLAPRVLREAALWLEQNQDADRFFLTVESFDPHEPWLVPPHYRKMYLKEDGREQVKSGYADTSKMSRGLLARTQANYSGLVTMCDRWFGYFLEQLRVLGLLDNTMVVFTTDHGHSIGDRHYMGKRGYPSMPEVYDVPLMIRFPGAEHAGTSSDMFVNHTDITATLLDVAGIEPSLPLDGTPFLEDALAGRRGPRDHVTIGWGSTPTVINDTWWFNGKVDGTGALLYDLRLGDPFAKNVARDHPDVVKDLFAVAEADAAGGYPEWIVDLARKQADAPGCSDLAARE